MNIPMHINTTMFKQTTLGPIYGYENAQCRWVTLDEKHEQGAVIQGEKRKSKEEQM